MTSELDAPLPDAVRARVVALAADALGRLPADHVPGSLKRVASFVPARRVRQAGNQIAAVLATDETFRERVAVQVRAMLPGVGDALEAGNVPAAVDPVELAALAYLLRPDGWAQRVSDAGRASEESRTAADARALEEQLTRTREQLEASRAETRQARERHREQVAELKAENTVLRQRLGEARTRLRLAEEDAARAHARAQEAGTGAAAQVSAAEAEVRRQRSRVFDLEREIAALRRTQRGERDTGTLRARLLLDTLLDTATGLRRELALPAVEGSPADAVEADVAEQGSAASSGTGSLAADDPALLEQLLALPRAHLVVDGYNVTKLAWPEQTLEAQRDRLLTGLAPVAARSGAEVTVVFDAADKAERPLVNRPRGVRVLFSPVGVIADDVIRQLVDAEPQGRPVVVVTSDREVVADVTRSGARAVASSALIRLLSRA